MIGERAKTGVGFQNDGQAEADLLASRRKAAADKAASIWNAPASALEATQPAIADHGYLKHKRIQPHGLRASRQPPQAGVPLPKLMVPRR